MDNLNYNTLPINFNPFADGEVEKVIAAIEPQQEIWLSCIIGGDEANCSFNQSRSLSFDGPLDLNALESALNGLIARHEALRSSFSADGQYVFVYKAIPASLKLEDLSLLGDTEQQTQIEQYHRADSTRPFDLTKGPLFRTILFRLSPHRYLLTLTAHHIICDGWSFGTLLENLGQYYSAFVEKRPTTLPTATSMGDYARETELFATTPDYEAVENYWLNRYRGQVPQLNLPADFTRPDERTYASRRDDYPLTPELVAQIQQLGATAGCSLVTTLLAAFEVYVSTVTGQRDIVIGLPAAGQAAAGHPNLVGHCVNLLPLRSQPDPAHPFVEYLKKRRLEMLDDYDHQRFTFGALLKKLNIRRDPSRVPLVPFVFNVDRGMDNRVAFSGLTHQLISNPRAYENFELFVNVAGTGDSLVLEWCYNTQLFTTDSIKRMMEDYVNLLQVVTSHPSTLLEDITFHLRPVLEAPVYSPEAPFISHLRTIADKYPNRTAIVCGDERITFGELEKKSNQLARFLKQEGGISKGNIVGVAMDRSIPLVTTMLAVLKSGAAYIPLDPGYPVDRINFMLDDSSAKLLLTQRRYAGLFSTTAREIQVDEHWHTLETYDGIPLKEGLPEERDLAYILYTSGSTGKPKGVMVEHHNLSNLLLSMREQFGFSPEDTLLAITTISFDISCIDLYLPLVSGGKMILVDSETARDDIKLLHTLVENEVTFMQATPTTWRMLIAAGLKYLKNLRIVSTGEPLPKDLMEALIDKGASLWNCYGPTETTVWSSAKRIEKTNPVNTIGRPIANTRFYVLDEQLRLQPDGAVGELYIAGAGVARGYLNRAELTAEKFLADIQIPEDRMYATGDLGRIRPDGEIECLGRKDNQVKIRGYRIELGEIEYHLARQEDILDAVVIAREDTPGDQRLVAYVVFSTSDREISVERGAGDSKIIGPTLVSQWKAQLRSVLPEYMIPNDWVSLSRFPLTDNNKIDRKVLPAPNRATQTVASSLSPKRESERMVTEVWCDILRLSAVNPTDDFFELGGHSLLAVQVMSRMEQATGKRLPLTSLFKFPILTDFAALFEDQPAPELLVSEQEEQSDDAEIQPDEPLKEIPTLEQQKEIWLSCLLGGEEANLAYNQSKSIELTGPFNITHFQAAVQELVASHEALRSTVSPDGEYLYLHQRVPAHVVFHDLSSQTETDRSTVFRQFIHDEMRKPFDLGEGPLFRVFVHRFEEQIHYVTLVLHHIICDATSMNVVLRGLSSLYNAYVCGESGIKLNSSQLSDYINEQLAFIQSEVHAADQAYWLAQYQGELPVLNLPLDFSRPRIRTYRGDTVECNLTDGLFGKLKQLASQTGFSIAGTVTTLVELLLYHRTQQRDIVLGVAIADQQLSGYADMVGHCVNILPLRSEIDPHMPFIDHLLKRKDGILDAYDHPKLTFGELLKKLNVQREQAHVPLVPVIVSMQLVDDERIHFNGLTHRIISNPRVCHTFELSINLIIDNAGQSIKFFWAYNTQLFTRETVVRMMHELELLMETVADTPSLPIMRTMVHTHPFPQFANYALEDAAHTTLVKEFIDQAQQHPDRIALVFEGEKLTYRDLDKKSSQLACYLNDNGVSSDAFVPLCIQPSIEMIVGLLGIWKAGAAYVPIDPELPINRIQYIAEQSRSPFILSDRTTAKKLAVISNSVCLYLDDPHSPIWTVPASELSYLPGLSATAYIIYTSGSTGNPKGVCITHRSLADYFRGVRKHLPVLETCTNFSFGNTISTDLGNTVLYQALTSGGTIHLFTKERFNDPSFIGRYFEKHQIDCMKIVPSHWKYLSEAVGGLFPKKLLIFGGEPLPNELVQEIVRADADCMVVNHYGPTETTIGKLLHVVNPAQKYPAVVPIGKPFSNTSIFVFNEQLSHCPIGVAGELYIGGEGLATGYHGSSELTDSVFIANPIAGHPHNKLYKTGDIVKWLPNGDIEYISRRDDQVKIRGNRIELAEIQNLILSLDGVKHCAVIADDDGNNEKRLVAYVVTGGAQFGKTDAIHHLSNQLPDYMIPKIWMVIDELPLNANGKLDKKLLPKAGSITEQSGYRFVAPRTRAQILLTQIWQNSLKLEKVSIRDNFFELGGHSLIAVKVMLAIEKETGKRLPMASLFEYSTVEKLATLLESDEDEIKWDSLVPIRQEGHKPPVYLVHGAGLNVLVFQSLTKYLDEEQPVYALQALGLNGQTELLYSLEEIAAKYVSEILENDPIGPYRLAGYSLGGKIAYEMARQLIDMGKKVDMLGIFDTFVSDEMMLTASERRQRKIIRQFRKLPFFAKTLMKYPSDFLAYQWNSARHRLKQLFSGGYVVHDEFFSYDREINRSYSIAYRSYEIKPLNIQVDLFRTKKRIYFLDDLEYLGWDKFAKKGVRIHEIDGDHKTFILPPYDKIFASVFQDCLDNLSENQVSIAYADVDN